MAEKYLDDPFDDIGRHAESGRTPLSEDQKALLLSELKTLPDSELPVQRNGQKVRLAPSHVHPPINDSMLSKRGFLWNQLSCTTRTRLLEKLIIDEAEVQVPPPVVAKKMAEITTKHEMCRLMHIMHDPQHSTIYSMMTATVLDRAVLDARKSMLPSLCTPGKTLGNDLNPYARLADIFKRHLVCYLLNK